MSFNEGYKNHPQLCRHEWHLINTGRGHSSVMVEKTYRCVNCGEEDTYEKDVS